MSDPMSIAADSAVSIRYTLRDDSGEIIDTNEGGELLTYIHGRGQIVEGVEEALAGEVAGFETKLTVSPEQGYGPHNDALVMTLPKERFDFEVEAGQVLHAETAQGTIPLQVMRVSDEGVEVDGNHPLAGKTLHFEIQVVEVRPATAEELAHGHVCKGCGHH